MISLRVNVSDRAWTLVVQWATARIELHRETTESLSATDQDRRDAAVRMDELRSLLSAPRETLESTRARKEAEQSQMKVY